MGHEFISPSDLPTIDSQDLILDGIIGYSLEGSPRGAAAEMIYWANEQKNPILALDIPSGLNATTGEVHEPVIRAAATMTLALPKTGLKQSPDFVGELYLADISVPPQLYSQPPLHFKVDDIFQAGPILEITQLS
jgi:NAD(P)H-hydrate epimerase